jgi:CarboxypepD_reg-like domain/TonB-dependent Receptor Plug Domain
MKRVRIDVFLCVILLIIVLTGPSVLAQTSGKIIGNVTNAETGEPLPGAAVVVRGFPLGASSDIDGLFVILRIPPGTQTIQASHIGFSTVIIENVEVLTDVTTHLEIKLAPSAIAGEEVVIVAERPLIRRDQTSMESHVRAEDLERMPVVELGEVIDRQAGVVRDRDGGLHIRGGRATEVNYLINGISITDDYNKSQAFDIHNEAVAELQVISGAFNAEYGNAMSGIVNITTKGGSNEFHGSAEVQAGDYNSGRTDIFQNIDDVVLASTSTQSVSLSGPIIRDRLTFFMSGKQIVDEGYMYGIRSYLPQGRGQVVGEDTTITLGDGSYVPMADRRTLSGQGTLQWIVFPRFLLKADFLGSQYRGRSYSHSNRYNPDGYGYSEDTGFAGILKSTWLFSKNTFAEMSFANRYNENTYSLYDDPHDDRYVHPDSALTPGYTFSAAGTDLSVFKRSTLSRIGKVDLTSQMSYSHQLKGGLQLQVDEVYYNDYTLVPKLNASGREIVPFEPSIESSTTINHDRYTREPLTFAAYVQDKIEYESVVINVGIRFDWFDPSGQIPVDPQDPNVYKPLKLSNKYHDLNGDGAIDLSEQVAENEFTLAERRSFWYRDTTPKYQVSPRFGIAYPITDRGIIHFSFGIFQQIPEYSLLYNDDESKLSEAANVYGPFGNPDLEPQRTTMYELGLSQQLTDQLAVNITGFTRDIRNWISAGAPIPTSVATVSYVTYVNRDLASVRGLTLGMEGRLSDRITLTGDYTYQIAQGTNSAPEDEYWAQLDGAEPTKELTPLNWDQHHTLNVNAFYGTGPYGITVLGRYSSGHPYTPAILTGERSGRSIIAGLSENSRRMPSRFSVDLFAYRMFDVSIGRVRLSMQVKNLFDSANPTNVFYDTGLADYTVNQDLVIEADEGYFIQPDFYSEPRSILLGISYEF